MQSRWFARETFRAPQPFTSGNSALYALFGPGLASWDSGVPKNACAIPSYHDKRADICITRGVL
jgi:hypothetical protein